MVSGLTRLLSYLISTPGALHPISLGTDELSREFDAVDAAGFSSALPAVIQYDINRTDRRMQEVIGAIMKREGVDALADGGLVSNVPAQTAWEMVQSGQIGSRNAFILGFDCFAPLIGANLLFLPLQRIAADNVRRNRSFAHTIFSLRRVPGALAVLPRMRDVEQAVRLSRDELSQRRLSYKRCWSRCPLPSNAIGPPDDWAFCVKPATPRETCDAGHHVRVRDVMNRCLSAVQSSRAGSSGPAREATNRSRNRRS
ncbi:MAG: patatin-like phospholipase family protein [Myxococcales bacterium]|nr:patatin-like phospholipase family protein [Myxococcales bacterium]